MPLQKELEASFEKIVLQKPEFNLAYMNLLSNLKQAYTDIEPYARDYYTEIFPRIELLGFAGQLNSTVNALEKNGEAGYNTVKEKVLSSLEELFKEYNATVDQKLLKC